MLKAWVLFPQRPQPQKAKRRREKDKPVSIKHLQVFSLYFSSQKMTPKSQKKIEKSYLIVTPFNLGHFGVTLFYFLSRFGDSVSKSV